MAFKITFSETGLGMLFIESLEL